MVKSFFWLVLAVLLVGCGGGDPPSTGDQYIMNGSGCPDGFEYLRDGETWAGCTFDVVPEGDLVPMVLKVTCGNLEAETVNRYESRPVWRDDTDPGLQVFWPGNRFACAKRRRSALSRTLWLPVIWSVAGSGERARGIDA